MHHSRHFPSRLRNWSISSALVIEAMLGSGHQLGGCTQWRPRRGWPVDPSHTAPTKLATQPDIGTRCSKYRGWGPVQVKTGTSSSEGRPVTGRKERRLTVFASSGHSKFYKLLGPARPPRTPINPPLDHSMHPSPRLIHSTRLRAIVVTVHPSNT